MERCEDCGYFWSSDRNCQNTDEGYCTCWEKYVHEDSSVCRCFEGEDDEEDYEPVTPECYLTTMIHNILGMPDEGYALKTLRDFRNHYMLNNPDLYVMLIEYDVIGPKIASCLAKDPQKKDIANVFYKKYILPTVENVVNKKYDDAIALYQDMTTKLKDLYNVDSTIDKKLDINVKTLGKARA